MDVRWHSSGFGHIVTTVGEVRQVATQWRNRAAHSWRHSQDASSVFSPDGGASSLTRFPESGQLFRLRVNPPQSPGQPEAGSGMYVEDVHGRRYVDFRGNTVQQVWGFATAGLLVHKGPVGDSSILYLPVH